MPVIGSDTFTPTGGTVCIQRLELRIFIRGFERPMY